ncbi:DUF1120 domain-containing protein [Cupriavidus pauculus]|nr:DUF1120 domain-containing protein [Cupriavidus pauculus]
MTRAGLTTLRSRRKTQRCPDPQRTRHNIMKLSIQHLLLVPLLVIAATSANAAESTDMAVKGTIRPAACDLSLSNGGVIDFKTIPASSLQQSAPTALAQKEVTVAINCEAETYVAMKMFDNRADTIANNVLTPATGIYAGNAFGLGKVDGKAVGSYAFQMFGDDSFVSNLGKSARLTRSDNGGATWLGLQDGNYIYGGTLYSWAETSGGAPIRVKTVTQSIAVFTALASKDALPDLTDTVSLDGSTTISLVYL